MKKAVIREKIADKTTEITCSTTRYDIYEDKRVINTEIGQTRTMSDKIAQKFTKNSHQYQELKNQHKNFRQIVLFQLLSQMIQRRKRYSFQMFKLIYMFPDDSFSQNMSINSYDRLFFQDQHIHTIVKIYETKEMESKIWAFLNLKVLHKLKKLQKFTHKIQNVQKRIMIRCQKATFNTIQQYSIRIKPERSLKIQEAKTIISHQEQLKKAKTQSFQTVKTQKNQFMKQTNQIIRVQIPPVKRIYMDHNDPGIRIIYPTPTKILTSRDILQRQKNNEVITVNKTQQRTNINVRQSQNSKIIENNQTHVKQNDTTRIIYPPRIRYEQSQHIQYSSPNISNSNNNTVKKIEPITIRASPSNTYYSRPVQTSTQYTSKYYGAQNPLVHTVNGDCTINIHHGCGYVDDKAQYMSSSSSRHKSLTHSKRNRYQSPNSHHNSCQYMAHNCCPSHHQPVMIIQAMCSCQQYYNNGYCGPMCPNCYRNPNQPIPNMYYIQERIQYLKHLQEMNKEPQTSRLYTKR